jgi:hypothetical protein
LSALFRAKRADEKEWRSFIRSQAIAAANIAMGDRTAIDFMNDPEWIKSAALFWQAQGGKVPEEIKKQLEPSAPETKTEERITPDGIKYRLK